MVHVFFFGDKSPDRSHAESAEKDQQGCYGKPLDTIDGLKEVFVHVT